MPNVARSLRGYMTDTLSEIEGESVEIASVSFVEKRTAAGKEYTQSIIVLTGGAMYRSSSQPVADQLARIPVDDFPIGPVRFAKHPSSTRGFQPFWAVEPADDDDDDSNTATGKTGK